ncbi:DUF397 domain-containing protein [Actinocorallia sp. API 0066]|uniref:DUF397 domain-containing protein n=1 Tax=Actinocorallia sp. API 0066 TaxID=2896846 RepID=UPI001E4EC904|nr:DUF397 domain-containing protein [Actinocorallia sp. API 0066]MCD0450581.1 DUF397 domain-containing protein [Actinocorallia sp. API 0066]
MKDDLYGIDISGAAWTTPCAGNVGTESDEEESCMEFTRFPGGIAIRDSKQPGMTPMRFSDAELSAFLGSV